MIKVTMIGCDNPNCQRVGTPENLKPLRPPYGWLTLKGGFFGCGPAIDVTVCSLNCLTDAIENAGDVEP